MEIKKNPKYDIHRQSWLFFNLSLVIILFVVNMAFEWRTEDFNTIDVSDLEASFEQIKLQEENQLPSKPQPGDFEYQEDGHEEKQQSDEEEIMIKVQLDVAVEGGKFDNSFLDNMQKKPSKKLKG